MSVTQPEEGDLGSPEASDRDIRKREQARLRKQRQRERERAGGDMLYETPDWQLFIDPSGLPQKAGCTPEQIGRVVLKELVDNALDAGAQNITLQAGATTCHIMDDGPGIDPAKAPELFAVNRPLLSSKQKRLPTRGMLGNGLRVVMGAVAAFKGTITVTTRGHRIQLRVDIATGLTHVVSDIPTIIGSTIVDIMFPEAMIEQSDISYAQRTIRLAQHFGAYPGPSLPSWYSAHTLYKLFHRAPVDSTVADVVADLFELDINDPRPAADLTLEDAQAVHASLPQKALRGTIGGIGEGTFHGSYSCVNDTTPANKATDNAAIPFCVEVWTTCSRVDKGSSRLWSRDADLLINGTFAIDSLGVLSETDGLSLVRANRRYVSAPRAKRASYGIVISLTTPYLTLIDDGKRPNLDPFKAALGKALNKAAGTAYNNMAKPAAAMSIKDAAYAVMKDAYMKASDNGTLPANARQIMYAARPDILRMTGKDKLNDKYFTQTLLFDYIAEHPEETANWDVVLDARGNLTEPHTGRNIPLGTLSVRQYVAGKVRRGPAVTIATEALYATAGPENRFRNVLFIEKEGFNSLFEQVNLAERFDLAIMSTKGMSVTASRALLDKIAPFVENVFVAHDFDVSGFSIFGTLAGDGRRYSYENKVPFVDLGLRLTDVEDIRLEAEPYEPEHFAARRETLQEHGATDEEIDFLETQRVELNAMTSRQLIDFIEAKLKEHGVEKLIPGAAVLEHHARRVVERRLTAAALADVKGQIAEEAATCPLPSDLADLVGDKLDDEPEKSWDAALADVLERDDTPSLDPVMKAWKTICRSWTPERIYAEWAARRRQEEEIARERQVYAEWAARSKR